MMGIGPSWRRVLPVLGLVPLLALAGCGDGYDVARREAAGPQELPADEACRFELSRQVLPVSRASWLTNLETIGRQHWPVSIYEDYRKHLERKRALGARAPKWPSARADRYRFDPYRGHARSYVVRPQGHTLFFVSLLTMRNSWKSGRGGGRSFHTVAVLDVDGGMREQVLVRNVEGGRSDTELDFQVKAVGSDVVLVCATVDSIIQIVGHPVGDGFEFSKPHVAYRLHAPALDLGQGTSPGGLHLIWTQPAGADRTLHYARSTGPEAGWPPPTTISETALESTANLVTDGGDVFVAWVDGRLDRSESEAPPAGRIMVAASRDDGVTFSRPVVISDLTDPHDTAGQLLVTISEQDLILYWSQDPGPVWGEQWNRATLDRNLQVVKRAGALSGDELLAAYRRHMNSVLDERADRRRPPHAAQSASAGSASHRGSAGSR